MANISAFSQSNPLHHSCTAQDQTQLAVKRGITQNYTVYNQGQIQEFKKGGGGAEFSWGGGGGSTTYSGAICISSKQNHFKKRGEGRTSWICP